MADSGTMMASAGMYGENDNALLHQKAEMIIKLFLKSEISPKLRVWFLSNSSTDCISPRTSHGNSLNILELSDNMCEILSLLFTLHFKVADIKFQTQENTDTSWIFFIISSF